VVVVVVTDEANVVADHVDFLPLLTHVYFTPLTVRDEPAGEHAAPGTGFFAALTGMSSELTKMAVSRGRAKRRFTAFMVRVP
jgi:hypothetical protein